MTMATERGRESDDLVDRLRTAIGRLSRSLRSTRIGGGLSPSHRDVLGTVARHGPMRLSQLAELEGMNLTMLSRIVGQLERSELVERFADDLDGRVVHVAVTREGRRLFDELRSERTAVLDDAVGALSERDVRRLREALPILEALADSIRTVRR